MTGEVRYATTDANSPESDTAARPTDRPTVRRAGARGKTNCCRLGRDAGDERIGGRTDASKPRRRQLARRIGSVSATAAANWITEPRLGPIRSQRRRQWSTANGHTGALFADE